MSPFLLLALLSSLTALADENITAAGYAAAGLQAAASTGVLPPYCHDCEVNAKDSVTVCLMRELNGPCEAHTFSCNFTPQEKAAASPWWIPGFRLRQQAPSTNMGVGQQHFSFLSGPTGKLATMGLYPCLGISLINPSCGHAGLAHVDVQDPTTVFMDMTPELQRHGCRPQDTSVFMLLSNLVDEKRPGAKREADTLYYRQLVCHAGRYFPGSNIKVLLKTKHAGESNDMFINRTPTGFSMDIANSATPGASMRVDYSSTLP